MTQTGAENYLYVINYQDNEESLCSLEMLCLFNIAIPDKWFFSAIDVFPSRSVFIKYRINVMLIAGSLESIEDAIRANNLVIKKFKFLYVNIDNNEMEYGFWKRCVGGICAALNKAENHENPEIFLGIVKVEGKWIFGACERNRNEWRYHESKPNTNSHSLGVRVARSIVNIVIENNFDLSIVDPCCGVGTVVIEAASMGLKIKGYDINKKIAELAKENLAFFGINNVIECKDMHAIEDHFNVSIADIPYGLFTAVSLTDQIEIIKTVRRISAKSIIITFDNMENIITETGFNIINRCHVSKGRFTRYINVCT